MEIREGLTFDDVLLQPCASDVLPDQTDLKTRLTAKIGINIPLLSAAMDTVTEATLAITMAQNGGIGVIHRNMSTVEQVEEVRKVKRFESGMVIDPITISAKATLGDLQAQTKKHNFSGVPVIGDNARLVGIITHRDVRFATDPNQKITDLMTTKLVTIKPGASEQDARTLLHRHRIERLLVVDDEFRCVGLLTIKDMDKAKNFPNACKDEQGRLRVAAASSIGKAGYERALALLEAGADAIIIDTAHGHSTQVIEQVRQLKHDQPEAQIIAGNIATQDAAESLIRAGADALKVGIGPGSICTTRIIAGVGVPQLSAIMDVCKVARKANIPVIADGGIKYSGDMAKALAAGAESCMIGSLLAGSDEAPGEVFLYQGRSYKSYRGMGSVTAMAQGSADRYFQKEVSHTMKLVPEGVEGRIPYKGTATPILHQLIGGIRASMGYIGAANIAELHKRARFIRITNAGLRESHVHDVHIARESPNYTMPN